nr:hypothetical protein [Bacteroidales bacterium]
MGKRYFTLSILALGLSIGALAQPADRQLWNSGWDFTKDGQTRTLDLPHDWGVESPFIQANPGETGKLSWWGKARYAKTLTIKADDLSKDIR